MGDGGTSSAYEERGGLRRVRPYLHEFGTWAKGRWLGRPLLEVVSGEFGGHPMSYWQRAVRTGLVSVNGRPTTPDYLLRNGDRLTHLTHRHEPAVQGSVLLVGETTELLALSKPASLPMHPCGAYNHNSLSKVLESQPLTPDQPRLYFAHRLDRVTSGLVVVAKSRAAAAKLSEEIRQNNTSKTYLARVRGRFPLRTDHLRRLEATQLTPIARDGEEDDRGQGPGKRKAEGGAEEERGLADAGDVCVPPVDWLAVEGAGWHQEEGEGRKGRLTVRVPVGVVSHREGVHACLPSGKASMSSFDALSYCAHSDTTLVRCTLHTGRTHQLRLHLQLLGNPIANDPCYGGALFFGELAKRASAEAAVRTLRAKGMVPLAKVPHFGSPAIDDPSVSMPLSPSEPSEEERAEGEDLAAFVVRCCAYCRESEAAELEHLLHCDGIWLHALRYEGKDWAFEAPPPPWAMPDCGCWAGTTIESVVETQPPSEQSKLGAKLI